MRRTLTLLVLVGLLMASCASQHQADELAFDTAPLFGMVYDEDNQPCAGVQLTVDGLPGPTTDIRGRFVIPNLSRGKHAIVARKADYEDLAASVEFLNRTDALHLTMTSFDQLLDKAQQALADAKWSDAAGYLDRAGKLDPNDGVLRYLRAVLSWKTGDPQTAVGYLKAIVDSGSNAPAVYLFLADIYQNDLKDPANAIANLESYLKERGDPDVEARLQKLKESVQK